MRNAIARPILALIWLLYAPVLIACAKPIVDVSIHGVNHSDIPFSYHLVDPAKPDSTSGGELIDPFAAGGTVCCFTLPKKWRPGIRIEIRSTHWLPNRPGGRLSEVKKVHMADVPRYPDGKPGEIWVLRAADGSMSVVSSDFQPDHPKWPGKLKGWPVPSIEYRRERWEIIKKHEEGGVQLFLSLLDEIEKDPTKNARESWEVAKKYDPSSIKGFSGPDDPRYVLALKEEYKEGLIRSKRLVKEITENRP